MTDHRCHYCLCKVCNKTRCPRGKYHCMPCYHGTVLECPFFLHKKVAKVYRIRHKYRSLSSKELIDLRNKINEILGEEAEDDLVSHLSIKEQLLREEQRHKRALKDICRNTKC